MMARDRDAGPVLREPVAGLATVGEQNTNTGLAVMFPLCSHTRMSTIALDPRLSAGAVPADLRIPLPPRGRRLARPAVREPAWREAMRWSLIGLTASMAAGEVALRLFGP
ncbi:hypothetical protein SAMN02745775_110174 [Falsiroseomonas stagni DSM 19981]|uniref:Uncharacterized protein n=2 Tax=Roseomonadaceae TaxID=3385906 RepID=A0A1I4DFI0_9PROT|nr:hypothetical protein SAMN02745775_110174 [Falsiroseomonas stagni DSM 19981]